MATASQAIERIATTTGTMPATVARAARAMRETDVSLWPQGNQGRGQGAHVEPHHLLNLILAFTAADPITTAPHVVIGYRQLACAGLPLLLPEQENQASTLLIGRDSAAGIFKPKGNFSEHIENLIEFLSLTENTLSRQVIMEHGFSVDLSIGFEFPSANVKFKSGGNMWTNITYLPRHGIMPGHNPVVDFTPPQAEAPIWRTVTITAPVFLVLADLWIDTKNTIRLRDTKLRSLPLSLPKTSGEASSEDETAAISPLPGTNAAALSDQPAQTELGTQQPHTIGEREKSQPPSQARVGRSRGFQRSDFHAEHRYPPAGAAA